MKDEELTLKLPKIPKDAYYEDYVAAILNTGGYFLQRSIHDNVDGIEMLELDVLATKIEQDNVFNTVIEIKSGGWGIKDVFKVYGWLNYLHIANADGAFIFQNDIEAHDYDTMKGVAQKMGIKLIQNKRKEENKLDDDLLKEKFAINIDGIHESVVKSFRYSFNLERVMLDYIRLFAKDHPEHTIAGKVYQYLRKLSNTSFIQQTPVDKLKYLSELSAEHSYIAAILDQEIEGHGVIDAAAKPNFARPYSQVCFPKDAEPSPVHVAMHAAILNKLYVLESIVEYISLPENKEKNEWEEFFDHLNFNSLNSNITAAIRELKGRPHFNIYPYFWQVFLYVFGGYILLDKKDEEYKLLSKITGLPIEEIESAIYFWDRLYPTPNGWFSNPINEHSKIFCLKMVSPPIAGIGTNFRIHLYADEGIEEPEELFKCFKKQVTGYYTYSDLIGWNNMAFAFLKADTTLHSIKVTDKSKVSKHLQEVEKFINSSGRYDSFTSIDVHLASIGVKATGHIGYIAFYSDGRYDLFVVKENNKCDKTNLLNTAKALQLNAGKLSNAIIVGTDPNTKMEKDDDIWMFSQFGRVNISSLDDVISASNF